MKFKKSLCVVVMATSAAMAFAEGPSTRPSGDGATTRPATQGSLKALMQRMEDLSKAIEGQVDDASQKDSTLKLVSDLQAATKAAKEQLPGKVKRMPEADKTKAVADYQEIFVSLLAAEKELSDAVKAGDTAAAHAAMEKMEAAEKKGHGEFRKKKAR